MLWELGTTYTNGVSKLLNVIFVILHDSLASEDGKWEKGRLFFFLWDYSFFWFFFHALIVWNMPWFYFYSKQLSYNKFWDCVYVMFYADLVQICTSEVAFCSLNFQKIKDTYHSKQFLWETTYSFVMLLFVMKVFIGFPAKFKNYFCKGI